MSIFLSTRVPVKTKEARKMSSLAKRLPKAIRARAKPGTCVTIYPLA